MRFELIAWYGVLGGVIVSEHFFQVAVVWRVLAGIGYLVLSYLWYLSLRHNDPSVNEPGLYKLIMSSRKPEAKPFQRWVMHDVLPSIRKTGRYEVSGSKAGNDQTEQLKVRRLTIMEMNAKTRQAKLLFDTGHRFRDRLSDKATESVLAVGAKLLTGWSLYRSPPRRECTRLRISRRRRASLLIWLVGSRIEMA